LLLDGHVRVVRTTSAGDQIIVLHVASGQLFGIEAALGHTMYPATAMTADESLTLSWPNELWLDFVARYDGFATETFKVISGRMSKMAVRIVDLATKQVEQRVASAMVRLISQNSRKVDAGIEIDFPITRQNISDMTGTTLFTVSRLLIAWEKDGIVASERRRIAVTKPGRLQPLVWRSGRRGLFVTPDTASGTGDELEHFTHSPLPQLNEWAAPTFASNRMMRVTAQPPVRPRPAAYAGSGKRTLFETDLHRHPALFHKGW